MCLHVLGHLEGLTIFIKHSISEEKYLFCIASLSILWPDSLPNMPTNKTFVLLFYIISYFWS